MQKGVCIPGPTGHPERQLSSVKHCKKQSENRSFEDMAPPIKPETAKALKATTDSITAMDKENKAIKYAEITSKLDGAIKSSNRDMIKLYLPKIDEVIEQMDHV